jgi:hypothetical protein
LSLLGQGFRVWRGGFNGGSAREIDDAKVGAVLVARETDGGDPGGSLVDKGGDQEEVQRGGAGGVAWASRGGGDGFAYGFDVGVSL